MKKLRILLLFLILMAILLTACGTSLQPTPTATETPLPTQTHTPVITFTPTITYTPKPTDTPTIPPSPTTEPSPTIPSEWKNWNGTIKDFDSYIEIKELSDLDKIIAYDRSQQTPNTASTKICDLKMQEGVKLEGVSYNRLEYDSAGKGCAKDTFPAKEFVGARLVVNTGQGQDTLLFIIQRRDSEYLKCVFSKSYIDQHLKQDRYYTKIFEYLYNNKVYLSPITEYSSTNTYVTGSFDTLREELSSLGYTYDQNENKDTLIQLAEYSNNSKEIPDELHKKIENSFYFVSFNFW